MTSSTTKRPKLVESMLKALSIFSFDFDIMSLSCMGVDYDYGSKLVGMVTLVVGLMLCPFLHLLRLRSKVLLGGSRAAPIYDGPVVLLE